MFEQVSQTLLGRVGGLPVGFLTKSGLWASGLGHVVRHAYERAFKSRALGHPRKRRVCHRLFREPSERKLRLQPYAVLSRNLAHDASQKRLWMSGLS